MEQQSQNEPRDNNRTQQSHPQSWGGEHLAFFSPNLYCKCKAGLALWDTPERLEWTSICLFPNFPTPGQDNLYSEKRTSTPLFCFCCCCCWAESVGLTTYAAEMVLPHSPILLGWIQEKSRLSASMTIWIGVQGRSDSALKPKVGQSELCSWLYWQLVQQKGKRRKNPRYTFRHHVRAD